MDSSIPMFDLYKKINFGRRRIMLDYDEVTPDNVIEVLQKAMCIHGANRRDCDYLIRYYLGDQDILYRQESSTSTINNKTVVNFAYPITREIVGYTLGNPIELVAKDTSRQKAIEKLSDIYDYEHAYITDTNATTYASICGLSYTITLPSNEITKDNTPDVPIVIDYLDPRDTFIVESNSIGTPQIMSCTITKRRDGKQIYTCYTDNYRMIIVNMELISVEINPIGKDPIVMQENSLFLTGDWEQAISVMNATNLVTSDSLNDIEGTIRSLLVIIGAEFEEEDSVTLKNIKDNRLLELTAPNGGNLDAKFISPQLDSSSVQNIRDYLDDVRNIITGIPDRENNGSNGGDTGTAVLNRNGWTDIEIVAKLKEMFIKKAKTKQLDIALAILKKLDLVPEDLTTMDISVSIGRHTTDNLTAKTSAFATLVATGELATIDCLELSGLTNRVSEVVQRGEQAKEERQKQAQEIANNNSDNNDPDNTNNDNQNNNQTDNNDDRNNTNK